MVEGRQSFPDKLAEVYTDKQGLETHLLQLDFGQAGISRESLLPFERLPDRLQVGGIETFSNRLSQGAQQDPSSLERGGWVHLQRAPKRLLYPITPSVGVSSVDENHPSGMRWVNNNVKPETYIDENTYPVVFTHSHPTNGTFSLTDIYLPVGTDQPVSPVVTIAATEQFNYLFLKTQETELAPWEKIVKKVFEGTAKHIDEANEYGERMLNATMSDDLDLFTRYMDNFDSDAYGFYTALVQSQIAADSFGLGFYYSKRDGDYSRLSIDKIRQLMEQLFVDAEAKK